MNTPEWEEWANSKAFWGLLEGQEVANYIKDQLTKDVDISPDKISEYCSDNFIMRLYDKFLEEAKDYLPEGSEKEWQQYLSCSLTLCFIAGYIEGRMNKVDLK